MHGTGEDHISFPEYCKWNRLQYFAECSSLKNATIPSGVTKLNDSLFDGVSENFAIYGYTGSYAESYAKDHSFKFVSVGTTEKLNFKITFNKNAKKAVLSEKQKTKLLKRERHSEPFRYLSIRDIISWDGIPEQERRHEDHFQVFITSARGFDIIRTLGKSRSDQGKDHRWKPYLERKGIPSKGNGKI